MTRRRRSATLAATALVAIALGGCSTEVDPEIAAQSTGVPSTSEFVARGTTAEMFDQIVAEAGALSEAIVANHGQRTIVGACDGRRSPEFVLQRLRGRDDRQVVL